MIKASRELSSSADPSARFYFVLYREFGVSRPIGQRLKSPLHHDPPQSLGKRFAASAHHTGRQVHGMVQTLDGRGRLAANCRPLCLMPSKAMLCVTSTGRTFFSKPAVNCVHDVERHPLGIEGKTGARRPCPTSFDEYPDSGEADVRIFPCSLAANSAFILPSSLKIRAGSESRISS